MEAATLPLWFATGASEYKVIGDCHGVCYGIFGIGSGRHVGFGDELERPSRDLDCVGDDIPGVGYGLCSCFGIVYVLGTSYGSGLDLGTSGNIGFSGNSISYDLGNGY